MPKLPDKNALSRPNIRVGGGVVTAKALGAPYSAADFGGDGGLGALGAGLRGLGAAIDSASEQDDKDAKYEAMTRFDQFNTEMEMEKQRFIREAPANSTADGIAQSWEAHSRPRYAEFYKSLPNNPKLRREFDYRLQNDENNKKLRVFNEGIALEDSNAKIQFAETAERLYGEVTPENIDDVRLRLREYAMTSRLRPGQRGPMYRQQDLRLQQEVLRRAEADFAADPTNLAKKQRVEELTFAATPKGAKESLARRRFQYDPELDDETPQERGVPPSQGGNMPMFPVGGSMKSKTIDDVPSAGKRPFSRDFGPDVRRDASGRAKAHAGLDIPGKIGDPVLAVKPGTIVRMGNDSGGYGPFVDIKYDDGRIVRHGHLGDTDKGGRQTPFAPGLKEGDKVTPGQTVGYLGVGGNAGHDFPHVHVEVFKDEQGYRAKGSQPSARGLDVRLDPREYFRGQQQSVASSGGIRPVATAYSPQRAGSPDSKMEGGYADARGGIVNTLEDWRSGKSDHVTVAGDASERGKRYVIPELTWIDKSGKQHTSKNIPVIVNDTGAAFKGAGQSKFDIPIDRDIPSNELGKQPFSKKQVEFVPDDVSGRGVTAGRPQQFAGVAQKGGTVTDVTPIELDPKTGEPLPQKALPQAASNTLVGRQINSDPATYGGVMVDSKGRLPVWHGEATGTHEYSGKLDRISFQQRQAAANRAESIHAKALGEIEADIKKHDALASKGIAPPFADLNRLKMQVHKADDEFLKERIARLEEKALRVGTARKQVPQVLDRYIEGIESASRDANGILRMDEEQYKVVQDLKAASAQSRQEIKKNYLDWARSQGHTPHEPLSFNDPESIKRRVKQSEAMFEATKGSGAEEPILFYDYELGHVKAMAERGGPDMLKMFGALNKHGGQNAARYFHQIAPNMPEAPWIGGLMNNAEKTGSQAARQAVMDAAQGAAMRQEYINKGKPARITVDDPTGARAGAVASQLGDAFVGQATAKQGLIKTAELIYETRAAGRGIDKYDEALWKESLSAAAGEQTVGDRKYGGIVFQNRGAFGGNVNAAILIPNNYDQEKFLEIRDTLLIKDIQPPTPETIAKDQRKEEVDYRRRQQAIGVEDGVASVPTNRNRRPGDITPPTSQGAMQQGDIERRDEDDYSGPHYQNGKPVSMADFRSARLVNAGDVYGDGTGDTKFFMALGDPTSTDPQYIKDGSGKNYVFDLDKFEGVLRTRRPDLYLDKDKKPPVGMMRLGGPGSFSVGEAASPVSKTLFLNEGDNSDAAEAKEMAKAGKSAGEIYETTGWFKRKNGRWNNEIDDSMAHIPDEHDHELIDFTGTKKLSDFFEHDDLYAARPDAKNIPVHFVKDESRAQYDGWVIADPTNTGKKEKFFFEKLFGLGGRKWEKNQGIYINTAGRGFKEQVFSGKARSHGGMDFNEKVREVVLHELQHDEDYEAGDGMEITRSALTQPYRDRDHEKRAFETQERSYLSTEARRRNPPRDVREEEMGRVGWKTMTDKIDPLPAKGKKR
jgi:murein DD-endopeptidase MepM/ murein hydrolase activator NlpD